MDRTIDRGLRLVKRVDEEGGHTSYELRPHGARLAQSCMRIRIAWSGTHGVSSCSTLNDMATRLVLAAPHEARSTKGEDEEGSTKREERSTKEEARSLRGGAMLLLGRAMEWEGD